MTARLGLPYESAFVSASDAAIVQIDQMHAVANRAGHSFIACFVGRRWHVGQALHFVSGGRAAIKKRIRTHVAYVEDNRQNSQLRMFT